MKSLHKTILYALLLLLIVIPATGKAIDGTSNLRQVGTIPLGSFFNIIWNNTLYTGEGNAVRCYNIGPGVNLSAISYKSFNGQIFYKEPVRG